MFKRHLMKHPTILLRVFSRALKHSICRFIGTNHLTLWFKGVWYLLNRQKPFQKTTFQPTSVEISGYLSLNSLLILSLDYKVYYTCSTSLLLFWDCTYFMQSDKVTWIQQSNINNVPTETAVVKTTQFSSYSFSY